MGGVMKLASAFSLAIGVFAASGAAVGEGLTIASSVASARSSSVEDAELEAR
jgi:hypothetical protein